MSAARSVSTPSTLSTPILPSWLKVSGSENTASSDTAGSRWSETDSPQVESTASTLSEVIQETLLTTTSERQGRVIDKDAGGAGMEIKKQQGYF